MKKIVAIGLFLLLLTNLYAQELYFPPTEGDVWETKAMEELGWCGQGVTELYSYLEENESQAFMLLKDGKIVLEKYFGTYTQDSARFWFSAAKSLTSVLTGIAQQEGFLNINNPTSTYLGSGWTSLATMREDSITVRHQLSMSTGLDESDFTCSSPECLIYKAPVGTRWHYHNAPYSLLRNVIENATERNYNLFTRQALMNKIGMTGLWVKVGYNNYFGSTARSMARFGLLVLNRGVWENDSILKDESYFEAMTNSSQEMNPSYGFLWWLNGKDSFIPPGTPDSYNGSISPDAPDDLILAAGAKGQFIAISHGEKIIMIRQGNMTDDSLVPTDFHNEIWKKINLLKCTTSINERKSGEFNVFPNPASDFIQIEQNQPSPFHIEIYSSTGNLIWKGNGQNRISTTSFSNGIYYLKLSSEKNLEYRKIIIQK